MEPWMSPGETAAFKRMLEVGRPQRVFEWGSGGSTVTFPLDMPYLTSWISLEHDAEWYEKVKAEVRDPRAQVVFVPPSVAGWTNQEEWDDTFDQFHEYVLWPLANIGNADLIFVDGRCRNACLHIARHVLAPGGAVVLHDANVEHPVGQRIYEPGEHGYTVLTRKETLEWLKPV